MILRPGRWTGRGSFVRQGQSLTTGMECSFEITPEDNGLTIKGTQTFPDSAHENSFSIWVTANDVGTYDVDAQFADWHLDGTAKLESLPNLGMLWSKDRDTQVAFTLFKANNGTGLRGFSRAGEDLLTWEIAMQEQHAKATGGNVISLTGRRRASRKGPGRRR
jgi:hypothetical protein